MENEHLGVQIADWNLVPQKCAFLVYFPAQVNREWTKNVTLPTRHWRSGSGFHWPYWWRPNSKTRRSWALKFYTRVAHILMLFSSHNLVSVDTMSSVHSLTKLQAWLVSKNKNGFYCTHQSSLQLCQNVKFATLPGRAHQTWCWQRSDCAKEASLAGELRTCEILAPNSF